MGYGLGHGVLRSHSNLDIRYSLNAGSNSEKWMMNTQVPYAVSSDWAVLGQSPTFCEDTGMSALPLKADVNAFS